jgi:hypothetical protein
VVVDAGGGDVGVAQPFLNLGEVGLMIERVGVAAVARSACAPVRKPSCPE